jgi:hypothetical protein
MVQLLSHNDEIDHFKPTRPRLAFGTWLESPRMGRLNDRAASLFCVGGGKSSTISKDSLQN